MSWVSARIFLSVLLCVAGVAPRVAAQPSVFGPIGADAVWSEPTNVDVAKCYSGDIDTQRPVRCLLDMMRNAYASPEAMEFTQQFAAMPGGDVGYISTLRNYGRESIATVELPLMRDTNAHSDSTDIIVNGQPDIVITDDVSERTPALAQSAVWLHLKSRHPNINVWEGSSFKKSAPRTGHGERFIFAYPLGESHAEAGRWNALIAYDFDPQGNYLGRKLVGISGQ
jgi:hypothetical protein